MTINQQFGIKAESTYGTPVAVDRFYEISGESLRLDMGRTRSAGLRAGQRVARTDRSQPYRLGASGGFSLDVPTKGFGVLLEQIMGGTASVGTITDSNYTQTHNLGSLDGKSFTAQVVRELVDGTDQGFTYHGCKVTQAEFSCDPEGVLTCDVTVDAEDEDQSTDSGTAIASVSYPSDFRVFSWVGGSMEIDDVAAELTSFSLSISRSLNTGRRRLRGSALKKEPRENGLVEITMSLGLEFTSMTHYNKFKSATIAGALSKVEAWFDGDVAHAGTTVPRIKFEAAAVDFGNGFDGLNLNGQDIIMTTVNGMVLHDGTNNPLIATYRTTDSAI